MKLISFYQEIDPAYSPLWGGPVPAPDSGAGKYSVPEVVGYLNSGYPILDVMELTTDVIGGSFRAPGGSSVLTDGHLVWREDLATYVERYRIDLPQDFLEAAESHRFLPPQVDHEKLVEVSVAASRTLGSQPRP